MYAGQKADSFTGSASFARKVIAIAANQGIARRNIYVTGHSLGAAEADFAAAKTGLSGQTFASPGINSEYTGRRASSVTNYVDAGDPIGNYAVDGLGTLAPVVTSQNIKHVGNVTILPNEQGLQQLQDDVTMFQTPDSSTQPVGTNKSEAIYSAIIGNGQYHHLTNYATDLGVTLYSNDASVGSELGFYPGGGGSSSPSTAQANGIDTSYIAASMTGGGVHQASSATAALNNASVFAANDAAHAMGIRAHHAG